MPGRRVKQSTQKITVLTDVKLVDYTTLDQYFQVEYYGKVSLREWRNMLKNGLVKIKCDVVWVLTGASDLPWNHQFSRENQVRKLIHAIIHHAGRKLKAVYMSGVIPRPDKELALEHEIKDFNAAINSVVKDMRKNSSALKNTKLVYLAVQRLFLERFSYFDMNTGKDAVIVRILRPVDRYFGMDRKTLNNIGLYHLKSFFLVQIGILDRDSNSWTGMVKRKEPVDVREAKKEAFMKTQQGRFEEVEHFDMDTDVEDDQAPPVFIQVKEGDQRRVILRDEGAEEFQEKVVRKRKLQSVVVVPETQSSQKSLSSKGSHSC